MKHFCVFTVIALRAAVRKAGQKERKGRWRQHHGQQARGEEASSYEGGVSQRVREAIRDGEKKQERDIGCVREEDAVARERD